MGEVLAECAAPAGEAGAREIPLPCPSKVAPDDANLEVLERRFAFAWLRKHL
jgi:hypothetical protein